MLGTEEEVGAAVAIAASLVGLTDADLRQEEARVGLEEDPTLVEVADPIDPLGPTARPKDSIGFVGEDREHFVAGSVLRDAFDRRPAGPVVGDYGGHSVEIVPVACRGAGVDPMRLPVGGYAGRRGERRRRPLTRRRPGQLNRAVEGGSESLGVSLRSSVAGDLPGDEYRQSDSGPEDGVMP
jgi:hypothetical protein